MSTTKGAKPRTKGKRNMMKCEFEQMIGKEVSVETFKIYNEMYLATDLSKQEFVQLLNAKAIPESEEAIERKRKANEFKEYIESKIADINEEIEDAKRWLEWDVSCPKYWEGEIRRLRNEIKTLKKVIS